MGFFLSALAVCLIAHSLADDVCPPPADISPCTCDSEGVNCMSSITEAQIKKAFKANFKYGGVRGVWIQGTPLNAVTMDLFNHVRSPDFYIELNNVSSVDMNAFEASTSILSTLSFFGNQLQSFSFGSLASYTRLQVLNFGKNQLRSIPDNAFSNANLAILVLGQNRIASIGVNAFAKLVNLQQLHLDSNLLTTLGPQSIACGSRFPGFQINLSNNQISGVSSTAFEGTTPRVLFLSLNRLTSLTYNAFFNLVYRMAQIGGQLDLGGNPLSCKGCTDYYWIVENKDVLHRMLAGFRCPDGTGIVQLTRYSIGC